MAAATVLNIPALVAHAATDFFFPKPDKTSETYTPDQVRALWNPALPESTEHLIPTPLGLINTIVGGNPIGPALVFWPSLMMRGSMYSYQYAHFRTTHRVVLIDSPGINKSAPLRNYIDLRDCVGVVIAMLDFFKIDKCVFGGNSWGAMLASVLPAYHPERCLGTMVINGTASLPSTTESIMATLYAETLMLNAVVPNWWVSVARAAFGSDESDASNPEFQAYCGVVAEEDPKSIAWALRGILLGRVDSHRLLGTITEVPVLIVAGEGDRQFPVSVCKSMASAIPTSKLVVAPGVGHLASRENPELINGLIEEFLAEIGASGR